MLCALPSFPSSLSGRPAVATDAAVTATVATAATNFEPAHVHAPLLVPGTFLLPAPLRRASLELQGSIQQVCEGMLLIFI